MILFPNTFGIANTTSKATVAAQKTPESAPEDLSKFDRYNPSEDAFYRNNTTADFTNKRQTTWKLGENGEKIKRYDLEILAGKGPVEVSFQRRVPDTSKPQHSKLRRLAEATARGGISTLAAAAFPVILLGSFGNVMNTFSESYTDAKFPWKDETIKGEFSVEGRMVTFQPKGQEKVDLGLSIDGYIDAAGG